MPVESEAVLKSAIDKHSRGEPLTKREAEAYNRYERDNLAVWGPIYARSCGKTEFYNRVGIQATQLIRLSGTYDLPYTKNAKTVDLWEYIRAWHDWEKKNRALIKKYVLGDGSDSGPEEVHTEKHWKVQHLKEKALKEKDMRAERERELLPRTEFIRFLQEFFVAPMLARVEQCERRDEPFAEEMADNLRADVKDFEHAIEAVFNAEIQSESKPRKARRTKPAKRKKKKSA